MAKANIKLQLSKLNPFKLLALIYQVIFKLTGNAYFPTPPVKTTDMQVAGDAFKLAIENALNGGKNERQIRDGMIPALQDMLNKQAEYVRMMSGGDAAKLGSSGFEMAKVPAPIGPINAPKRVKAITSSVSGNINLSWTGAHGVKSYEVLQCTKDPSVPENWSVVATTSKNRWTSTGNTPGSFTYFAIIALGAAGNSGMSAYARGLAA